MTHWSPTKRASRRYLDRREEGDKSSLLAAQLGIKSTACIYDIFDRMPDGTFRRQKLHGPTQVNPIGVGDADCSLYQRGGPFHELGACKVSHETLELHVTVVAGYGSVPICRVNDGEVIGTIFTTELSCIAFQYRPGNRYTLCDLAYKAVEFLEQQEVVELFLRTQLRQL